MAHIDRDPARAFVDYHWFGALLIRERGGDCRCERGLAVIDMADGAYIYVGSHIVSEEDEQDGVGQSQPLACSKWFGFSESIGVVEVIWGLGCLALSVLGRIPFGYPHDLVGNHTAFDHVIVATCKQSPVSFALRKWDLLPAFRADQIPLDAFDFSADAQHLGA